MQKLDELDIICCNYQAPFLIESYNIFYGKWPNFSCDIEEQKKRKLEFQLMICILSEYNILDREYRWNYDYIINVPYSEEVNYQVTFLTSRMKSLNSQEIELEKICEECPLSDKQKEGIQTIAYIIGKQIENKEIDCFTFLKQLCNVIYFRKISFFAYSKDDDFVTEFLNKLSSIYPALELSQDLAEERFQFVISKLRLLINTYPVSIDRVIQQAKQDGMDDQNLCCGLLYSQDGLKPKILTKEF